MYDSIMVETSPPLEPEFGEDSSFSEQTDDDDDEGEEIIED